MENNTHKTFRPNLGYSSSGLLFGPSCVVWYCDKLDADLSCYGANPTFVYMNGWNKDDQ